MITEFSQRATDAGERVITIQLGNLPAKLLPVGLVCHGDRGRLTYRGRHGIQCHVCGNFYRALGPHINSRHEMNAAEYRREFLLGWLDSLVSEGLHDRLSRIQTPRLRVLSPKANARAVEVIAAKDGEWRQRMAEKASQRQGGRSFLVRHCVVCGNEFTCPINSRRTTCGGLGSTCDEERRRRKMLGKTHSDTSKQRMRAKRKRIERACVVCSDMFAVVPSSPRKTCGRRTCVTAAIHSAPVSAETRAKISAAKFGKLGRKQSKEERERRRGPRLHACKHGHVFTPENTMLCGEVRRCRQCRSKYNKKYQHDYYRSKTTEPRAAAS